MNQIPKIIHYCWFGNKPIPETELRCMESWSKYLPDYKLMFWNEESFDLNDNKFVREAYDQNKFAFVSDYVRVWALHKYGGFYLDTDLEILTGLDKLLESHEAVLGFENKKYIGTAIMAFIPDHSIMRDFVDYYADLDFVDTKGNLNIVANPTILASIVVNYGIKLSGEEQCINNIKVFERSVFYPKKNSDNSFVTSDRTVAIHHFSASWLSDRQKKRGTNRFWIEVCRPILRMCMSLMKKLLGDGRTKKIEITVRNILK